MVNPENAKSLCRKCLKDEYPPTALILLCEDCLTEYEKKIEECKGNEVKSEVLKEEYIKYLNPLLIREGYGGIAPNNAKAFVYDDSGESISFGYLTPENKKEE